MRELPLDSYEQRLGAHLRLRSDPGAEAFDAAEPERRRAACEIVQDKAQTLDEAWPLIRFLFGGPLDDADAWERVMTPDARSLLAQALEALRSADGFDPASVEAALSPIVERSGRSAKAVYQPIRVAITGTTVSPGVPEARRDGGNGDRNRGSAGRRPSRCGLSAPRSGSAPPRPRPGSKPSAEKGLEGLCKPEVGGVITHSQASASSRAPGRKSRIKGHASSSVCPCLDDLACGPLPVPRHGRPPRRDRSGVAGERPVAVRRSRVQSR